MSIAVEPDRLVFNARQDKVAEEKFLSLLVDHKQHTEVMRITRPEDAMISRSGKLQGKFTLTTLALSQLCTTLTPGLIKSVQAMTRTRDMTDQSRNTAVRWVNDSVALYFEKIDGRSLVVDHQLKRVEGVVGRKYAFLPNVDLFERTKEFIDITLATPAEFCESIMVGRRMMLRFRNTNPLFKVKSRRKTWEPFFGGYHFSNSEVGECAVRAAAVIIRQICDNKAISSFEEGGKIPHLKGPKFERSFQELLDGVAIKADEATTFKGSVQTMMRKSLKLGESRINHEGRMKRLKSQLVYRGLHTDVADAVLKRALNHGSYKHEIVGPGTRELEAYALRTFYDLFNALTHVAKGYSPSRRESIEQLAYQLLTNKISLN